MAHHLSTRLSKLEGQCLNQEAIAQLWRELANEGEATPTNPSALSHEEALNHLA